MEANKKKHYKKPQLQEVKLVPEEAVLTNCKTAAGKHHRSCIHKKCAPGHANKAVGS